MRGKGFLMLPAGVLCVLFLCFSGCGNDEADVPLEHGEANPDRSSVEAGTEGTGTIEGTGTVEKNIPASSPDNTNNVLDTPGDENHFKTTGSFQGWEMITVSSEVDGVIKEIKVEIGDEVKKGDLLVKLVDTDYKLNVARNEAALAGARANLENARIEFERKEMLYEDKTIPKSIYDISQTRLDQAQAGLRLAEVELDLARERLEKTRITAPVAGSVESKYRSRGEYINMMVGYNLIQLVMNDPLKLVFTLPERFVTRVRQGQAIWATVPAIGEQRFEGKIHAVSPSVDPRTRTLKVEARFENKDRLLRSGLFALVYFPLNEDASN